MIIHLSLEAVSYLNEIALSVKQLLFVVRHGHVVTTEEYGSVCFFSLPINRFFGNQLPSEATLAQLSEFKLTREIGNTLAITFMKDFNAFVFAQDKFPSVAPPTPLEEFRRKRDEVNQYASEVRAWLREMRFFCHDDKEALGYADYGMLPDEDGALTYGYDFPLSIVLDDKFLAALAKGKKLGVVVAVQRQVKLDRVSVTLKFNG